MAKPGMYMYSNAVPHSFVHSPLYNMHSALLIHVFAGSERGVEIRTQETIRCWFPGGIRGLGYETNVKNNLVVVGPYWVPRRRPLMWFG